MRDQSQSSELETKSRNSTYQEKKVEPLQLSKPKLPFSMDALDPWMSEDTLDTHLNQHHKKYVETSNKLLASSGINFKSLEDAIYLSSGKLNNNLAQAWNHTFFWKSIDPEKKGKPSDDFKKEIEQCFGSVADLKKEIIKTGTEHFASGWVWLVAKNNSAVDSADLAVLATGNAALPDRSLFRPLWVCDLWEHAFYLDYKNGKEKFLTAGVDRINWDFVESNFRQGGFPNLSDEMLS